MDRVRVRSCDLQTRSKGWLRVLVGAAGLLPAWTALAQEPAEEWSDPPAQEEPSGSQPRAPGPDAEPAPESESPTVAIEAEAASTEPVGEGTAEPAQEPAAEPVQEAAGEVVEAPEEPAPAKAPLKVGMGIRAGTAMVFNDPAVEGVALRLDDGVVSQLNVRPYFSGQLTDNVGFTGNFEVTEGSVDILDAIVQVKVVDELQVWFGQHIPAMERNNFNGPFYNNSWNLPIAVQTAPFDIAGRDRGATVWGLVGGGVLKYHLSVVDLAPPASTNIQGVDTEAATVGNARFAARATINLLDPENYYYTSGTYYGAQDTLAIAGVVQSQKGVESLDPAVELDNDLLMFAADLLFEKNLGAGGTFTLEGGYWNFEGTGADYVPNQGTADFGGGVAGPLNGSSYLAAIGWLTPEKVGYGKINPHVKVQIGDYEPNRVVVADFGLGYIVDGFDHRWFLNYRYMDMGGEVDPISMLQMGAQLQL